MNPGNLLATPEVKGTNWRTRRRLRTGNKRRSTELGLLVISTIITVSAYIVASLGKSATIPSNIIPILVALIALSLAAHIGTRILAPNADPIILPIASLLNGLGFVMITRIDYHEAILQAIWSAVGVVGYISALYFIRNSAILDRYRYLLGFAGIGLLMLPLVPKLGVDIGGERLWVHLGPITVQPVEAAKLLLAVFFASYFV
ncbi:MAG: FtsW/RodA/SpoVE family cell cycle protein, partial [Actinomycetota bacterium]